MDEYTTDNKLINPEVTAATNRNRLIERQTAPRRLATTHYHLIRVRGQLIDDALNSCCVVAALRGVAHLAITSLSNNRISCAVPVPVPPLLGIHCQGHGARRL